MSVSVQMLGVCLFVCMYVCMYVCTFVYLAVCACM